MMAMERLNERHLATQTRPHRAPGPLLGTAIAWAIALGVLASSACSPNRHTDPTPIAQGPDTSAVEAEEVTESDDGQPTSDAAPVLEGDGVGGFSDAADVGPDALGDATVETDADAGTGESDGTSDTSVAPEVDAPPEPLEPKACAAGWAPCPDNDACCRWQSRRVWDSRVQVDELTVWVEPDGDRRVVWHEEGTYTAAVWGPDGTLVKAPESFETVQGDMVWGADGTLYLAVITPSDWYPDSLDLWTWTPSTGWTKDSTTGCYPFEYELAVTDIGRVVILSNTWYTGAFRWCAQSPTGTWDEVYFELDEDIRLHDLRAFGDTIFAYLDDQYGDKYVVDFEAGGFENPEFQWDAEWTYGNRFVDIADTLCMLEAEGQLWCREGPSQWTSAGDMDTGFATVVGVGSHVLALGSPGGTDGLHSLTFHRGDNGEALSWTVPALAARRLWGPGLSLVGAQDVSATYKNFHSSSALAVDPASALPVAFVADGENGGLWEVAMTTDPCGSDSVMCNGACIPTWSVEGCGGQCTPCASEWWNEPICVNAAQCDILCAGGSVPCETGCCSESLATVAWPGGQLFDAWTGGDGYAHLLFRQVDDTLTEAVWNGTSFDGTTIPGVKVESLPSVVRKGPETHMVMRGSFSDDFPVVYASNASGVWSASATGLFKGATAIVLEDDEPVIYRSRSDEPDVYRHTRDAAQQWQSEVIATESTATVLGEVVIDADGVVHVHYDVGGIVPFSVVLSRHPNDSDWAKTTFPTDVSHVRLIKGTDGFLLYRDETDTQHIAHWNPASHQWDSQPVLGPGGEPVLLYDAIGISPEGVPFAATHSQGMVVAGPVWPTVDLQPVFAAGSPNKVGFDTEGKPVLLLTFLSKLGAMNAPAALLTQRDGVWLPGLIADTSSNNGFTAWDKRFWVWDTDAGAVAFAEYNDEAKVKTFPLTL